MSLNNNQMLPEMVRNMRQMNEVLNAEDVVLSEMERIIDEAYQRASLLHEELVNEEWLETRLEELTGDMVSARKRKNELYVEISITGQELQDKEESVKRFVEKWLPAHLAYGLLYQKVLSGSGFLATIWQDDEELTLKEVRI